MSARDILHDLMQAGVSLRLAKDGVNLTAPAGTMTTAQRELVIANKPAIVTYLQASSGPSRPWPSSEGQGADTSPPDFLMETAMLICDKYEDSEAARAEMRADIENTPPELRADLLANFREVLSTTAWGWK